MNTKKEKLTGIKKIGTVCSLFFIVTGFIILLFCCYYSYSSQIYMNTSTVSSICSQTDNLIENYRQKIEGITKSFFSHDEYVNYNCTANYDDSYNRAKLESEISDELSSIGLMEQYATFGIIYSNDHRLGNLGDDTVTTLTAKESSAYDSLEKILGRENNLWYTIADKNYKDIFYIRRANSNAIFVASVFKDNLRSIMKENMPTDNVNIIITDKLDNIICDQNNSSGMLDPKYSIDLDNAKNGIAANFDFIVARTSCFDNWKTVVILDLKDQANEYRRIAITGTAVIICAVIMIWLICFIMSENDKKTNTSFAMQSSQTVDPVTGLSNAETAENLIIDKIERCKTGSTIMLALVSLENYQLIKENYGRSGTEEALVKTANALTEFYGEENIVGKTSENEFIIFADFTEYDLFAVHNKIKSSLKELEITLADVCLDNNRGAVKYSVGAAIYPDNSSDYDELYDFAKQAQEHDRNNKFKSHFALYQKNGKGNK